MIQEIINKVKKLYKQLTEQIPEIITPKYYLYHKQRFDLSEKALKTVLGTEWKELKKQATIEELQEFERIVYLSRNTRLLQNRKRK